MNRRQARIRLRAADRVALEILREVWRDWRYATDAIALAFRRNRSLGSDERRRVAGWVYGMVRMDRHVEEVLATGLRPLGRRLTDFSAPELADRRLMVYFLLFEPAEAARAAAELTAVGLEPPSLERASRALERDLAKFLSYPDWLVNLVIAERKDVGDGRALLEALNLRAPLCIRANTLKIAREALIDRLASEHVTSEALPLAENGLVLDVHPNVFSLPSFQEGLFEVQDEASQLVADLCAPPPGGLIVDACAGAGGKTLALGARLEGKGRIVALDIDKRKLANLGVRTRRAGLTNVQAKHADEVPDNLLGRADRVLVDAPCSGLGALRRNPEARWRLTHAEVSLFGAKQLALLERYSKLVAPGGRLIYVTCTFLTSENDDVVAKFLGRNPSFTLVPAKEILGRDKAERIGDGTFLRTFPHKQDCDAFFGAVFRLAATPDAKADATPDTKAPDTKAPDTKA